MGVSRADYSVKNWRNLTISNPKQDLHNINAHTKFGENPLMFTRYYPERKNGWTDGRRTDRWADGRTGGRTHWRPTWNHNTLPLLCGGV